MENVRQILIFLRFLTFEIFEEHFVYQNKSSSQIFCFTRCITRKRVTSLRGPSPRHCAQATQLLSK